MQRTSNKLVQAHSGGKWEMWSSFTTRSRRAVLQILRIFSIVDVLRFLGDRGWHCRSFSILELISIMKFEELLIKYVDSSYNSSMKVWWIFLMISN